jgi:hypothetical protein
MVALLSAAAAGGGDRRPTGSLDQARAAVLLAVLNAFPIIVAAPAALIGRLAGDCSESTDEDCDIGAAVLEAMGLVCARLARLDLCGSLLLCARGQSAWMLGVSAGRLGYAESIPLHRTAGWWCMVQVTLHTAFFLLFYLRTGGLRSLWTNCLPTALDNGELNRLGLVNGMGLLALLCALGLALPGLPWARRRRYHVFKRLHLPAAAMFAIGGCLHDFHLLLFAMPGFACWYVGSRYERVRAGLCPYKWLPAKLRMLPGTSAPWLVLTVQGVPGWEMSGSAPRGQWALVRIVSLGREAHPLSIARIDSADGVTECTFVISSWAGDWTRALGATLPTQTATAAVEVEVAGPFPFGGGSWSLVAPPDCGNGSASGGAGVALLLIAGGTGVTGWLPMLASAGSAGRRCHLIWCVQSVADYRSLASWLPAKDSQTEVTVFVTRSERFASEAPPCEAGIDECAHSVAGAPQQDIRSSSPAVLSAVAVLAATLAGLLVGYVCGRWVHGQKQFTLAMTLAGYTLLQRVLPVVLTAAATAVTAEVSCLVLGSCSAAKRGPRRHRTEPLPLLSDGQPIPQGDLSAAALPQLAPIDPVVYTPSRGTDAVGDRLLREGRPDLVELVRKEAAAPDLKCLVVAACGPARLVQAARMAVAAASKERIKSGGGGAVRIVFSGSDSEW